MTTRYFFLFSIDTLTLLAPLRPVLKHIFPIVQTPFRYGDDITVDYILDCSVPQGSVLGPQQFSAYTSDIPSVLHNYASHSPVSSVRKQAYASGRVSDVDNIRRRLSECASDIAAWCASRRLQLNSVKTEAIWFGSHANLSKLTTCNLSVTVNNDNISPAHSVCDLGVILDDELNMKQHVNSVAKTCFYHLRPLYARFAVVLDMMSQCDLCLQ